HHGLARCTFGEADVPARPRQPQTRRGQLGLGCNHSACVSRTILTKLSQAWCAIHRTQFSWSRMHSLASIADGSTNLLLNIGCRPPTSGQTMYAKAVCRPIAPTWMKFTIARPI